MTRRRLWLTLLVTLILAAGCGDDDGGATTVPTTAATPTTSGSLPPAPTELRFTFDGVTGFQDKALVGTVFAADGPVVGTVCVPVTGDPFSGSAVVATAAPDNPCSHEAPYGVPLTADGAYSYLVAAYTPGTQTATACASGEVIVEGPTEVVIGVGDITADNCAALAG